jgi:hypothetical protein
MSHYHAVVWIDHQRATVWQFTPTEQANTVIHAHGQHQRAHSPTGCSRRTRNATTHAFAAR